MRRDVTVDAFTLSRLAETAVGASSAFVVQILDRLGRGGDDIFLLHVLKALDSRESRATGYDIALIDAWLRMYEAGHMPSQAIIEIVNLAAAVDLVQIEGIRPDLIKRLDFVLTEAGIKQQRHAICLKLKVALATAFDPAQIRPIDNSVVHRESDHTLVTGGDRVRRAQGRPGASRLHPAGSLRK